MVAQSLRSSLVRLAPHMPLSADSLAAPDEDFKDCLDAFVIRFTKLQDLLGLRLFRGVLEIDLEQLPQAMIDTVAAMERRGIVPSVTAWQSLRLIRNRLTHEYEETPEVAAAHLAQAYTAATDLLTVFETVREYVHGRTTARERH